MSAEPGHDGVDPRHGREIGVPERGVGVRGERLGERLEARASAASPRSRGRRPRDVRRSGGGARSRRRAPRAGRRTESSGRSPSTRSPVARDQHDRPVEPLDEARRDDADHALVPVVAPDDVATAAAPGLGPRLDLRDRRAEDPVLDRLTVAVQRLELAGERLRLLVALREQELERRVGAAETAGGVDARCEPEADRRRRRSPAGSTRGGAHQRPQPGLLRPRERAQAGDRERAVLVDERHDVGDRRERDEVRVPRDRGVVDPSSACASLCTTPVPQSSGNGYPTAASRRSGSPAAPGCRSRRGDGGR